MSTVVTIRGVGTREKLMGKVRDALLMVTCAKEAGKMASNTEMANFSVSLAAFSKGTLTMERYRVTVRSNFPTVTFTKVI